MAVNINLTNLTGLGIPNSSSGAASINSNNAAIIAAFEDCLALDGTTPNQMQANLDMNSFRILNLPQPLTADQPLRLQDLNSFVGGGTVTNIPAGGTAGQYLVKTDNIDYHVQWTSFSPLITGGSGVTSSITYKTTTGVGTTGADHIFKGGNNGGTEIIRFLNSGVVSIPGATASVSTSTGALVVTGGVGIGGALNVSSSYAGFGATGVGYAFDIGSGAATVVARMNSGTSGTNVGSTFIFASGGVGSSTFGTYSGAIGGAYNNDLAFWTNDFGTTTGKIHFYIQSFGDAVQFSASKLNVSMTTASSSSSTGALVVAGGVGVGGKVWTGDDIHVTNTSNLSRIFLEGPNSGTTVGGAYNVTLGGVPFTAFGNTSAILGGAYSSQTMIYAPSGCQFYTSGGNVAIVNAANTASSSSTTGSLVVQGTGGLGVGGAINSGASSSVTQSQNADTSYSVTNNNAGASASASMYCFTNAGTAVFQGGSTAAGGWGVFRWSGPGSFFIDALNAAGNFNFRTGAGPTTALTIDSSQNVLTTTSLKLSGATGGLGYATGAGGTITQATSKATGVTLSKSSGAITMNNAALAAATIVSFVLTNTAIAATDVLILNHISGGTIGSYTLEASCAAGSATIYVRNNTAGSLSEAIVIQFALIKAVNA